MTKASLEKLSFITELLDDGDLAKEELEEFWKGASKTGDNQINLDAFVQIFNEIDDLFEDDQEEPDVDAEAAAMAEIEAANATVEGEDEAPNDNPPADAELPTIFKSIADGQGLLTREGLAAWEEVQTLKDDGLLGQDEFDAIWDKMPKTDGLLDLAGFLKFNAALDDLFEFEDEDEEEAKAPAAPKGMVEEEGLSPSALFTLLANEDGLVGMAELSRWGELQEMLGEGELEPLELKTFFDEIVKTEKQPNQLSKNGFVALYGKIDALFEDEEDDEDSTTGPASTGTKEQLLATFASLNGDEERLPCGLESTDSEQKYVEELVTQLETEETNEVRLKQGAIELADLAGEWELLYSSSSAMAYNKGLSGLGGSFPNGAFAGLKMKLVASKYMCDVEYTERIKVVPDTASFDVTVNGSWDLRSSVSIFTGEPSVVLAVTPDMVTYGPTSTRADHWKSLGPTNMLDVSYLDMDLRIMRGNTSTDSILVFRRTK